jgi:hypothetical protein
MKPGPQPRPLEERFWAKVEKTDECWLWIGNKDRLGYGSIRKNPDFIEKAHRVSWELHFGPIPADRHICHHCDVRHCVRPDHLFLGNAKSNSEDACRKGKRAQKLTETQVREIRITPGTQEGIALNFGVSRSMIALIRLRQRWQWLV